MLKIIYDPPKHIQDNKESLGNQTAMWYVQQQITHQQSVTYNILLDNTTCHNLEPLSEYERPFMLRTCIKTYKPEIFQMKI